LNFEISSQKTAAGIAMAPNHHGHFCEEWNEKPAINIHVDQIRNNLEAYFQKYAEDVKEAV
jgi:hypothetical protein